MAKEIEILYEDDDLVIVSKPAGMLTIPDRHDATIPSLNRALEKQLGTKPWIVHRLDRETSGVICFAKNEVVHRYLSMLFEAHEVTKLYAGIVNGQIKPESARIDQPIAPHPTIPGKMVVNRGGKQSVTDYKVSEQWPLYALVSFQIHTGRTHQIRVHMQHIGHSLVGDKLYGDGRGLYLSDFKKKYHQSTKDEEERPILGRIALHAYRLGFVKEDGTMVTAESPLPKDMAVAVKQLQKWS